MVFNVLKGLPHRAGHCDLKSVLAENNGKSGSDSRFIIDEHKDTCGERGGLFAFVRTDGALIP